MALSTLVVLFSTVVLSLNRCPLSGFLSSGNSQKSQGAMSGLYGRCRSNAILCFLRNCCTRFDECAGALSWWRSQSPHTRESFLKSCLKFPKQFSVFRDHFLVHEQLIDDHLQSQVAPAQYYPMCLSPKVGQNENHYQQKCALFRNDYTTLLFVFCSCTHSQRPSASPE